MPGLHHPFSPSSLERRIACPGSYLLEKNLPPMPENPDAAEGTRLHAACATGDLTGLDPEQRELVEKCLAFAAEVCGSAEFKREVPLRLIGPGGAILTGGGALYSRSREILNEVFDLSCQVRRPADVSGAVTDLGNPRYSAIWGALKVAAMFSCRNSRANGALEQLVNGLNRMFNQTRSKFNSLKKSIKL